MFGMELKTKIEEASSDECDYEKDYIKQTAKISFNDYNYQICF